MKKVKIIYLLVIFITILQLLVAAINNKEEVNNSIECITEVKNAKYIKDIENEFKNINNLTILSYNKINETNWVIKCVLKGSKDLVMSDLEKINEYYVNEYNLSYDKENILLELELISK